MTRNNLNVMITLLVLAATLVSACSLNRAPAAEPTQTKGGAPTKAAVSEPTVQAELTPLPERKNLVVCVGEEPNTLYLYGGSSPAASHIEQAIYDGPIDNNTFAYQPVIFDRLPSLSDGSAVVQTIEVKVGDTVVDDYGNVVELTDAMTAPAKLRPAGCESSTCAVDWTPVSGTLKMEQMVATFRIKDGVVWADGQPVTANDSVFAFKLYMDPNTPNPDRYVGEHTASYVARDAKTVIWTGLPGYRDGAYFTNFFGPLPEHVLSRMTPAEVVTSEEASRLPLGYGAFTMKEWVVGDHVTVVKNPYYFRASEGLPKVDEVTFRFLGRDPNAAIVALVVGECDILTQELSPESMAPLMHEFEAKGQIKTFFATGTNWEHVDFGILSADDPPRPDFFGKTEFRQAFGMCLNRQQVVNELLYGRSPVIASYVPPEHPLYNTDLQPLPYDVPSAKAILEGLGWVDVDGDGIRECSGCNVSGANDGDKLSFQWSSTDDPLRVAYMQIFQTDLKECGIDVQPENLTSNEWFSDGPAGPLFGRHFAVGSFAWLTGVEPPCSMYLTSEIPGVDNNWTGQNDTGWSNLAFDAACSAALQSLPGTPEYAQYHKEAQKIFAEDLPVIPLFLRLKLAATRPDVTGLVLDPTNSSEMWNIENMALESKTP